MLKVICKEKEKGMREGKDLKGVWQWMHERESEGISSVSLIKNKGKAEKALFFSNLSFSHKVFDLQPFLFHYFTSSPSISSIKS